MSTSGRELPVRSCAIGAENLPFVSPEPFGLFLLKTILRLEHK
jgi:hypothetical protein